MFQVNHNSSANRQAIGQTRKTLGIRRGRVSSIVSSPARKMDIPQPRSKVRVQGRISKPSESRNSIVLKQQKKAQEVVIKLEKLKIHKDESILYSSSQGTQSTMPTEESKFLDHSSMGKAPVLIREDFEVFDYLIKKD